MSFHKKLFTGGSALILLSVTLLVISEKLINCVNQTRMFPSVLGFINKALSFSTVLIPIGLCLLYLAFIFWKRSQGKSIQIIVYESILLFLFVGFIGSVILASLSTSRSKGRNAATLSAMSNMRSTAELFFDRNGGTYKGFCLSREALDVQTYLQKNIPIQGLLCKDPSIHFVCNDEETNYAVSVKLFSPYDGQKDYFCVDSTGFAKDIEESITGTSCK